jgi:hypothetical protein
LWSENAHEINAGDARKASMESGRDAIIGCRRAGHGHSFSTKPAPTSLNGLLLAAHRPV